MSEIKVDYISIKDAAMRIGCDHHYVRQLVKQGRLQVDHTEPINSGVEKVFLSKLSVKQYMEERRERTSWRIRVTPAERRAVVVLLAGMRTLPDW